MSGKLSSSLITHRNLRWASFVDSKFMFTLNFTQSWLTISLNVTFSKTNWFSRHAVHTFTSTTSVAYSFLLLSYVTFSPGDISKMGFHCLSSKATLPLAKTVSTFWCFSSVFTLSLSMYSIRIIIQTELSILCNVKECFSLQGEFATAFGKSLRNLQ